MMNKLKYQVSNLGRVWSIGSQKYLKGAIKDGRLSGAVTQDPLSIGRKTVELAVKAAKGESVSDVDTGCQWYTAKNMDDPKIAPNLYD